MVEQVIMINIENAEKLIEIADKNNDPELMALAVADRDKWSAELAKYAK